MQTRRTFCIATLVFAAWSSPVFSQGGQSVAQEAEHSAGKVLFFSTAWCGNCRQARNYMNSKNIPYIEKDVEKSTANREEYKRLGGTNSIPFFVMDKKTFVGFSKSSFDRAYAEFRNPGAAAGQYAAPRDKPEKLGLAGLPKGAVLVGKRPGTAVYSDAVAEKQTIFHVLLKHDKVTYLGEERNGMLKVATPTGPGWVVKHYVTTPQ
jgi:glutaredoxin